MKLYNYFIKFNRKNGEYDRTDHARGKWTPNRARAEEALQKDLEWCGQGNKVVVVVDYGIEEKEDSGKYVLRGLLDDNGRDYEDFKITVGGVSLYDALYAKYQGNNVRLTLEILSD